VHNRRGYSQCAPVVQCVLSDKSGMPTISVKTPTGCARIRTSPWVQGHRRQMSNYPGWVFRDLFRFVSAIAEQSRKEDRIAQISAGSAAYFVSPRQNRARNP
jgi:hypothetical protein